MDGITKYMKIKTLCTIIIAFTMILIFSEKSYSQFVEGNYLITTGVGIINPGDDNNDLSWGIYKLPNIAPYNVSIEYGLKSFILRNIILNQLPLVFGVGPYFDGYSYNYKVSRNKKFQDDYYKVKVNTTDIMYQPGIRFTGHLSFATWFDLGIGAMYLFDINKISTDYKNPLTGKTNKNTDYQFTNGFGGYFSLRFFLLPFTGICAEANANPLLLLFSLYHYDFSYNDYTPLKIGVFHNF